MVAETRRTYGLIEIFLSATIFYIPVILINLLRLDNRQTLTIIYTYGMFLVFLYVISYNKYGVIENNKGFLEMPK